MGEMNSFINYEVIQISSFAQNHQIENLQD